LTQLAASRRLSCASNQLNALIARRLFLSNTTLL
jgi:hypothetical protein